MLFYAFCIAFLLLGTGTVLYAQGWRFDVNTWSIKKVGGIFIKIYPRNASILLDGIPVQNASWLLQSGTFINNLFPRTYALTLRKEGFHPWTRHITVTPSFVAEVSNAVLVPRPVPEPSVASNALPALVIPSLNAIIATSTRWSARAVNAHGSSSITLTETQGNNASSSSSPLTLALESPVRALAWNNRSILGILTKDGTLLQHNPLEKEPKKVADDVVHFSWNSDGNKIAALERRSLEIFDLENSANYYRFNIRGIGDAERLIWYRDNTHLFIVYPHTTVFFDFDDANIENIIEAAPTNRVSYDEDTNTLYFLEKTSGTLQALTFPK